MRTLCRTMSIAPIPMVSLLRALSGGFMFALLECFPLFAIGTIPHGGLGLSKKQLGGVLSVATVGIWVYSTFLQGRLLTIVSASDGLYVSPASRALHASHSRPCALRSVLRSWPPAHAYNA